jgi:hypothetical protein
MITKNQVLKINPNLKPSFAKFLSLSLKHHNDSLEFLQEYINYSFHDILDNQSFLDDYLLELNKMINPNKTLTNKSLNLLTTIINRYQWDADGELQKYMELESKIPPSRETRCRLRKFHLNLTSKDKLKLEYLIKEILELGGMHSNNKIKINHLWKAILLDDELYSIQRII